MVDVQELDKLVITLVSGARSLIEENAALKAKVAKLTSTNNERIANCAAHEEDMCCRYGYVKFCGDVPCRMLIAQSASIS